MDTRRWFNPHQPQTLQIAVILLYINAAFRVLFGAVFTSLGLALTVAGVAAGFGIANERKWGYGVGIGVALAPFALVLLALGIEGLFDMDPISLMFDIALVALLVHPQSREYQRIWFK